MKYAVGIDVGNATTEATLGKIEEGELKFYSSGISKTTGLKGTKENVIGITKAIDDAIKKYPIHLKDITLIRINEATPVIGDFAMETITETIITESTLIGHNPDTPGGVGLGCGETVCLDQINHMPLEKKYIVVIPETIDFIEAARIINQSFLKGYQIEGAILKNDDGVLINNRISKVIPIVDEVEFIEKVPLGMKCAVEVAPMGHSIDLLSNPYGIATVFDLSPKETVHIMYVARALIGSRSAVVIKTPLGNIKERKIPAGKITILGKKETFTVSVDAGAQSIMQVIEATKGINDIKGEKGTNAGGMFEAVKREMAKITEQKSSDIFIKDIMAVDTLIPIQVKGSLANEYSMEKAVGVAAMVKTKRLIMESLAEALRKKTGIHVEIGGVEGDMAVKGTLTTPGTEKPIAIVDIGAGSTDASYMDHNGKIKSAHLAGAGDMVTMMINSELGLDDVGLAENIKIFPLARVESLFHIRHEDGNVQFFNEPLDSKIFARVVIVKPEELIPILKDIPLEKIVKVRKEAKDKVLIQNTMRALRKISITGSIKDYQHVVLVGGSSLDFEFPNMVTEALSYYGISSGKGNIRGKEGPRNAVATGLLISFFEEYINGNKQ